MLYSPVMHDESKNVYEPYRVEVPMIVYITKPEGGVKYLQSQVGAEFKLFDSESPYRQLWYRYYELDGDEDWYPMYLASTYHRGSRMNCIYCMLDTEAVDGVKSYLQVTIEFLNPQSPNYDSHVTIRRFSLDGTQIDIGPALVNTTSTAVFKAMY